MRKFCVTSSNLNGEIVISYNEKGQIINAAFTDDANISSLFWIAQHFPVEIEILEWLKTEKLAKVTEIIEIEFDHFWNAYDKKEGSKALIMQYWYKEKKTINKRPISDEERMQIMTILPRYVQRFKGEQKKYQPLASTFLNERLWEAEYERLQNDVKNRPYINKMTAELLGKWNVK